MRTQPTVLVFCLTLSTAAAGAAGLIDIGSRKQLLWDEYLIESLKDTRFVMNPATKATNNPVISRDKPWLSALRGASPIVTTSIPPLRPSASDDEPTGLASSRTFTKSTP